MKFWEKNARKLDRRLQKNTRAKKSFENIAKRDCKHGTKAYKKTLPNITIGNFQDSEKKKKQVHIGFNGANQC